MVDYSQFAFHERDHSYGYSEEVSVVSLPDYPSYYHRHHYPIRPEVCQDLPLNLSLNSPPTPGTWDSQPANATPSPGTDDSEPATGSECSAVSELGSLFLVSDLGEHIAQEEIVESEAVEDDNSLEDETEDDEEASSDEEEEDESLMQALTHETSRNYRLRSKVNDLTKKITRIRALLEATAEKEKNADLVGDSKEALPLPPPHGGVTESRVSLFGVAVESDLEIKSEGELDSGEMMPGLRAMKRSRNQSWPQMLDSNARKKEQNKMASKRFRERKKQELEKARLEIQELETRNERLRHKADRMQREADSLKQVLVRLKLIRIVEYASGNSTIQRI